MSLPQPANYNMLSLSQAFADLITFLGLYVTPRGGGGEGRAIHHFEIALRTTSSSDRRDGLHLIRFDLAGRFLG